MKTIYYAFVQKLEVPDTLTEEEIDNLVFQQLPGSAPLDYVWSEKESDILNYKRAKLMALLLYNILEEYYYERFN